MRKQSVIGTHCKSKLVLSGLLLLFARQAVAQGSTANSEGGSLGAEPGLPAEAPAAAAQRPNRAAPSTTTLPAPSPEPLVQPYDDLAAPADQQQKQQQQPSQEQQQQVSGAKNRPAISGRLAELNLSDEQAQQIVELRRQWKPEAEKRTKEEFGIIKEDLAQAMADNSPAEEVRRRFEMLQKKYLELQTMKFEKLLRIREVLTPEQRRKFAEQRFKSSNKNSSDNN